ncbi:omptin family outer membrane protease [Arcobacter sp. FWKO B]|uniref:omptin family outer membrane protease n=1 Tax=Arcobacter sp. FWKO B TaxID=2593672 RepID=UPI0018A5BB46|nr:omptin family outer membrane protease [Arcobacter sp. FWKO B]QOG11783.1 omptin family outer membrane protease [Arcobacter sp. FWKO B]
MINRFFYIILVLLSYTSMVADESIKFDLQTSYSNYSSTAKEVVYKSNGSKLSELIWKVNNAKLLGLNAEIDLYEKYFINIGFKKNHETNNNRMDDYDWMYNINDWTHWSGHPNTKVEKIEIFDIKLNKQTYLNENTNFLFGLGFKKEQSRYTAYDGEYVYSTTSSSLFRDKTGTFSGKGITYAHTTQTPYLNFEIHHSINDWDILFMGKYSSKSKTTAIDIHHMRDLEFTDNFKNMQMINYSLGIKYHLNKNFSLLISYEHMQYKLKKGTSVTKDLTNGSVSGTDIVGFGQEYDLSSFAISYRF